MEHPGLDILQIKKDLSLEEIQEKIRALEKRRAFAYRLGKQEIINQLDMMLAVYTRAQSEILKDIFSSGENGSDYDGKIDIS